MPPSRRRQGAPAFAAWRRRGGHSASAADPNEPPSDVFWYVVPRYVRDPDLQKKLIRFLTKAWPPSLVSTRRTFKSGPTDKSTMEATRAYFATTWISDTLYRLAQACFTFDALEQVLPASEAMALFGEVTNHADSLPAMFVQGLDVPPRDWAIVIEVVKDTYAALDGKASQPCAGSRALAWNASTSSPAGAGRAAADDNDASYDDSRQKRDWSGGQRDACQNLDGSRISRDYREESVACKRCGGLRRCHCRVRPRPRSLVESKGRRGERTRRRMGSLNRGVEGKAASASRRRVRTPPREEKEERASEEKARCGEDWWWSAPEGRSSREARPDSKEPAKGARGQGEDSRGRSRGTSSGDRVELPPLSRRGRAAAAAGKAAVAAAEAE